MRRSILAVVVMSVIVSPVVMAGIPEPDAVLLGRLTIGGRQIGAGDPVTIYATVPGAPDRVGAYTMGQSLSAGDLFVLRIRLESLADGSSQSTDRALIGQTAMIYAEGDGVPNAPQLVGGFKICERGVVRRVDLPGDIHGAAGDFDNDCIVGPTDVAPFVRALLGLDASPEARQAADVNGSGTVDGNDIKAFLSVVLDSAG